MIEPERFDLIGELAAGFPAVVIAEQTVEVYAKDLSDLPIEVLRSAVAECRAKSRFFPTVAEIREVARLFTKDGTQPPVDCPRCFGVGMEVIKTPGGYTASRRCDHVVDDTEDVSMF